MAIVAFPSAIPALKIKGQFGFGRGYGGSQYGKMRYGFFDPILGAFYYGASVYGSARYGTGMGVSGIYSRKRTLEGWRVSRMKFYGPTNTQQPAQQAWRGTFADGVVQYHLLTTDEQAVLSREGRKRNMSGYNLFMSRWLQSHRT